MLPKPWSFLHPQVSCPPFPPHSNPSAQLRRIVTLNTNPSLSHFLLNSRSYPLGLISSFNASFSRCCILYPTPPNHHDSSILFPTFLSERLIHTALSLGLLEPYLLTCSLSLTSSSCCGSLFSLGLCLRCTFFHPDPPQSRCTCGLIHVSVFRLFFFPLAFQVTLLTLLSPRFLSPRGSSFPLLSPQPCSPTTCSILMERCLPGTFTPLRHSQIQLAWFRRSFANITHQ